MAADEREISSLSRAGSGVDEPLIARTREGYDLWWQTYDDEDNPLIALEEAAFERLLGEVRGLTIADIVMAATRAGLCVDHMSEHAVGDALVTRSPRARKHLGWPLLLLMRPTPTGR